MGPACVSWRHPLNPHSPQSLDHSLWTEGLELDLKKKRMPEWLDEGQLAAMISRLDRARRTSTDA